MYNISWLQKEIERGTNLKYIYFWGHTPKSQTIVDSSCFSQWYESPFFVNGVTYRTAEHWMMAYKARMFNDKLNWQRIVSCEKPGEAKALGRSVENYNDDIWKDTAFDIVKIGNIHKFNQSPDLFSYLKQTNNRVLVEASPVDTIWGIGLSKDSDSINNVEEWRGTNLLGFALMEARDFLLEFGHFETFHTSVSLPWIDYAAVSPQDMFWRTGKGETIINGLVSYYRALAERQRTIFRLSNPPLGKWKDFYNELG